MRKFGRRDHSGSIPKVDKVSTLFRKFENDTLRSYSNIVPCFLAKKVKEPDVCSLWAVGKIKQQQLDVLVVA